MGYTRSCLRYRTRAQNDVYTFSTLTVWIIGSLVENLPERDNLSTTPSSEVRLYVLGTQKPWRNGYRVLWKLHMVLIQVILQRGKEGGREV